MQLGFLHFALTFQGKVSEDGKSSKRQDGQAES